MAEKNDDKNGETTKKNSDSTGSLSLKKSTVDINAEDQDGEVIGFFADVNKVSKKNAECRIGAGFKEIEEPSTPEARCVAPELVKYDFFDTEDLKKEYVVQEERGHGIPKKKKSSREIAVFLPELHKHGRYIVLVGAADNGKTILIKRYCAMVLEGKILKEIRMVYLINIKNLPKGEMTPKELLFGTTLPGDHKKQRVSHGYKWMQKEENQPLFLLAFDGLDTAPWDLTGEKYDDVMSYDDKRPAATIIRNILCGQLFPKCKILMTSREYGIAQFPQSIRPDAFVGLKGFTRKSIKILVTNLGGKRGAEIWKKFAQKSLSFMLLCSTPIFLIFAIDISIRFEELPENFSGIIILFLKFYIQSAQRRVKPGEVKDILKNLQALSYDGILEGKVNFTKEDLNGHGLNKNDVKDLLVTEAATGEGMIWNEDLLEDNFSYPFCHQSIQELLAALHACTLAKEEFEEFANAHLRKGKFIVVWQMLLGVLFNDKTAKEARQQSDVVDVTGKQKFLLEMMEKELKNCDSSMKMLNLLISLQECGGHQGIVKIIRKHISKISLSGIPLNPSDLLAVAGVARHCDKLDIMQLVNCHLNKRSMAVLADGMEGSDVKITVFDVSFNSNLRKNSMFDVKRVCVRGQGLNYWQCGFRQKHILDFNDEKPQETDEEALLSTEEMVKRAFDEDQVIDLHRYIVENHFEVVKNLISEEKGNDKVRANLVEYNTKTNVEPLCKLLHDCEDIEELSISESELTEKQLVDIKKAIKGKNIDSLNIFLNPYIEDKGWIVLGATAKTCSMKNLNITACSLTEVKLKNFKMSLQGFKVLKLNVSRNDDMNAACLREIGEIVVDCGVEQLVMGYCNLKHEHMENLESSVTGGKIHRIDMSGNDNMGVNGYCALGKIVSTCNVEELDISECDPSAAEIKAFRDATPTAQITKLNVSRNRHMGPDGLKYVGQLVGQCKLKTLLVRQCELKEDTLRSLLKGFGEAKMPQLGLGFYFMKPRPTTDAEVDILAGMLSHVTKELTISDWIIDAKGRTRLQQALDNLPFTGLKVVLHRGKNEFIEQKAPSASTDLN